MPYRGGCAKRSRSDPCGQPSTNGTCNWQLVCFVGRLAPAPVVVPPFKRGGKLKLPYAPLMRLVDLAHTVFPPRGAQLGPWEYVLCQELEARGVTQKGAFFAMLLLYTIGADPLDLDKATMVKSANGLLGRLVDVRKSYGKLASRSRLRSKDPPLSEEQIEAEMAAAAVGRFAPTIPLRSALRCARHARHRPGRRLTPSA